MVNEILSKDIDVKWLKIWGNVKTRSLTKLTDKGVPKRLKETCWNKIWKVIEVNEEACICDKGARVIAKKYHTKFQKTNYKTKQKWLVWYIKINNFSSIKDTKIKINIHGRLWKHYCLVQVRKGIFRI